MGIKRMKLRKINKNEVLHFQFKISLIAVRNDWRYHRKRNSGGYCYAQVDPITYWYMIR